VWEFFRPWKRKIGVLTLVMACVFVALWLRSKVLEERVILNLNKTTHHEIISSAEGLILVFDLYTVPEKNISRTDRMIALVSRRDQVTIAKNHGLTLQNGFGWKLHSYPMQSLEMVMVVIPHWLIAIPLTMLSAWLVLSKPRPAKSQTPVEPIPDAAV
jgi:hypothetical protein